MKLELSEQTKVELKQCYEKLQQELKVKVEERELLIRDIDDMQECKEAIDILLRLSIPSPRQLEPNKEE